MQPLRADARHHELTGLAEQYGAGEVVVQPIYVRTTQDADVLAEVVAIAKRGRHHGRQRHARQPLRRSQPP